MAGSSIPKISRKSKKKNKKKKKKKKNAFTRFSNSISTLFTLCFAEKNGGKEEARQEQSTSAQKTQVAVTVDDLPTCTSRLASDSKRTNKKRTKNRGTTSAHPMQHTKRHQQKFDEDKCEMPTLSMVESNANHKRPKKKLKQKPTKEKIISHTRKLPVLAEYLEGSAKAARKKIRRQIKPLGFREDVEHNLVEDQDDVVFVKCTKTMVPVMEIKRSSGGEGAHPQMDSNVTMKRSDESVREQVSVPGMIRVRSIDEVPSGSRGRILNDRHKSHTVINVIPATEIVLDYDSDNVELLEPVAIYAKESNGSREYDNKESPRSNSRGKISTCKKNDTTIQGSEPDLVICKQTSKKTIIDQETKDKKWIEAEDKTSTEIKEVPDVKIDHETPEASCRDDVNKNVNASKPMNAVSKFSKDKNDIIVISKPLVKVIVGILQDNVRSPFKINPDSRPYIGQVYPDAEVDSMDMVVIKKDHKNSTRESVKEQTKSEDQPQTCANSIVDLEKSIVTEVDSHISSTIEPAKVEKPQVELRKEQKDTEALSLVKSKRKETKIKKSSKIKKHTIDGSGTKLIENPANPQCNKDVTCSGESKTNGSGSLKVESEQQSKTTIADDQNQATQLVNDFTVKSQQVEKKVCTPQNDVKQATIDQQLETNPIKKIDKRFVAGVCFSRSKPRSSVKSKEPVASTSVIKKTNHVDIEQQRQLAATMDKNNTELTTTVTDSIEKKAMQSVQNDEHLNNSCKQSHDKTNFIVTSKPLAKAMVGKLQDNVRSPFKINPDSRPYIGQVYPDAEVDSMDMVVIKKDHKNSTRESVKEQTKSEDQPQTFDDSIVDFEKSIVTEVDSHISSTIEPAKVEKPQGEIRKEQKYTELLSLVKSKRKETKIKKSSKIKIDGSDTKLIENPANLQCNKDVTCSGKSKTNGSGSLKVESEQQSKTTIADDQNQVTESDTKLIENPANPQCNKDVTCSGESKTNGSGSLKVESEQQSQTTIADDQNQATELVNDFTVKSQQVEKKVCTPQNDVKQAKIEQQLETNPVKKIEKRFVAGVCFSRSKPSRSVKSNEPVASTSVMKETNHVDIEQQRQPAATMDKNNTDFTTTVTDSTEMKAKQSVQNDERLINSCKQSHDKTTEVGVEENNLIFSAPANPVKCNNDKVPYEVNEDVHEPNQMVQNNDHLSLDNKIAEVGVEEDNLIIAALVDPIKCNNDKKPYEVKNEVNEPLSATKKIKASPFIISDKDINSQDCIATSPRTSSKIKAAPFVVSDKDINSQDFIAASPKTPINMQIDVGKQKVISAYIAEKEINGNQSVVEVSSKTSLEGKIDGANSNNVTKQPQSSEKPDLKNMQNSRDKTVPHQNSNDNLSLSNPLGKLPPLGPLEPLVGEVKGKRKKKKIKNKKKLGNGNDNIQSELMERNCSAMINGFKGFNEALKSVDCMATVNSAASVNRKTAPAIKDADTKSMENANVLDDTKVKSKETGGVESLTVSEGFVDFKSINKISDRRCENGVSEDVTGKPEKTKCSRKRSRLLKTIDNSKNSMENNQVEHDIQENIEIQIEDNIQEYIIGILSDNNQANNEEVDLNFEEEHTLTHNQPLQGDHNLNNDTDNQVDEEDSALEEIIDITEGFDDDELFKPSYNSRNKVEEYTSDQNKNCQQADVATSVIGGLCRRNSKNTNENAYRQQSIDVGLDCHVSSDGTLRQKLAISNVSSGFVSIEDDMPSAFSRRSVVEKPSLDTDEIPTAFGKFDKKTSENNVDEKETKFNRSSRHAKKSKKYVA